MLVIKAEELKISHQLWQVSCYGTHRISEGQPAVLQNQWSTMQCGESATHERWESGEVSWVTRLLYTAMDMLITVSQTGSFTLLTSSHQSLASRTSEQTASGGMYENAIRNLPLKNPKEISFSESATRPQDRALSLAHSRVSIYSMYLPSPEPQSQKSHLNVCMTSWNVPQDFFWCRRHFKTIQHFSQPWNGLGESTVHMWLPTSVFCPPPFWGVKSAVFMLKYYNMLLQNKFQLAVNR